MTTTRETADHADHIGEATTMIDHAELARLAEALRETKYRWTMGYRDDVLLNPDGPKAADALDALLSEIAALRASASVIEPELGDLEATNHDLAQRLSQAERQRDEAVGLLRKFNEAWRSGCGWLLAMNSLDDEIAAFLANQGADPAPVKKERAWICPQDNTPCPPECDSDDRRHCASVACKEQPA